MARDYFKRVKELTPTRFWINNVTRDEANWAIEAGAIGCTQNPSYVNKMIQNEQMRGKVDELIRKYRAEGHSTEEIMVFVQRDLVLDIAQIFKDIYDKTNGRCGYVSIQGDPFHEDAETIIRCALLNTADLPNMMAKVPVTEEGLKAIRVLAARGVPINATEVMSVRQALDVCEVYAEATRGMEKKAPIYYSHITGILDQYLTAYAKDNNIDINRDVLWQAGIAAAKKTYHLCKKANPEVGFIGGGARGLQHFTEMVGADANITINWKGTADKLLEADYPVVERFHMPTPDYVIDELLEKLPDYPKAFMVNGIKPEEYEDFGPVVLFRSTFEQNWQAALEYIENLK